MIKRVLVGRYKLRTLDERRHRTLKTLVDDIIASARDSTHMDSEFPTRDIEELMELSPVQVVLPANEWSKDSQGLNHERWFVVSLYIDNVKASLERQGLQVSIAQGGDK